MQQTFLQLNNVMQLQANIFKSKEMRFMTFLLNFWRYILQEPEYTDRKEIFIEFAADIKDLFDKPQTIVEKVVEKREVLINMLSSQEKKDKQWARILRFIFEYLIECFELKQQVSTTFFLNQLVTLLVSSPNGPG